MSAKIIDGNKIAESLKQGLKSELEKLKEKLVLVAVQVGENPASKVYIKNQKSSCEEAGIIYNLVQLAETISESDLIAEIEKINRDKKVTGIILQLPIPPHINSRKIQMAIKPEKDVEGVTPENLGKLLYADTKPTVAPCTALSVMECIKSTGENIKGKEAVIVGHSEIVGKPVTLMLLSSLLDSATPTVCHIATKDLATHTKRAEILIVAAGIPGLIKGNMIKEGAIVIDVGINCIKNKIIGDVDFDEAVKVAGYITPVPGGVGAVTTVILLKNLLYLYKTQIGN
ncbi:MAG: bifunctional 5,10-methylene-tetrahydrofolate dehydrogenase/5,10-methylene-tetrahydrofolate cyclohydrolase [Elusimicrobia bacterium A5]|nr:MAG: bifunctional 5,10-methylene-tetrahydrofolate dehydrogenase/5,10-methylene-tetrahydrofolate cyclohydrolase [Elusimicrobia bacterium A5]